MSVEVHARRTVEESVEIATAQWTAAKVIFTQLYGSHAHEPENFHILDRIASSIDDISREGLVYDGS